MEIFQGLLGSLIGYLCYKIVYSSPKRKSKIPQIKFRLLEISPHLMLHFQKRSFHIHHWMSYPVILIVLFNITSAFTDLIMIKTFLIGATLEGISAKDRFKIVYQAPQQPQPANGRRL